MYARMYVCMNVLPICISMYHVCAWYTETRRQYQISWDWSCKQLSHLWVLGINPGPLEEQAVCSLLLSHLSTLLTLVLTLYVFVF